jgi:hypothetical protein
VICEISLKSLCVDKMIFSFKGLMQFFWSLILKIQKKTIFWLARVLFLESKMASDCWQLGFKNSKRRGRNYLYRLLERGLKLFLQNRRGGNNCWDYWTIDFKILWNPLDLFSKFHEKLHEILWEFQWNSGIL